MDGAPEPPARAAGPLIEWTPLARDEARAVTPLAMLERAFRAVPGDVRLATAYGASLMNQLAFDQAVEPLVAAVATAPTAAEPRIRLATCQVRQGDFEDALATLAFDFADAPATIRTEAAYVQGCALAGLGNMGAAETALRAALTAQPGHTPAFRKLSTLLAEAGRNDELIALCDALAANGVGHSRLLTVRANTLAELGRLSEAAAMLDMTRVCARHIGPPAGFASIDAFNSALSQEVIDHPHLAWPEGRVYSGGRVHHLLQGRRPELILALAEVIRAQMEHYVAELGVGGPVDPWPLARPALARLDFWGVVHRHDDNLRWHIHANAWLSAVYYAAAPADLSTAEDGAGCLEFGPPPESDRSLADLVPTRRIGPEPGLLVLAPSYFHHRTIATGSGAARVSVPFDLMPAGAHWGPFA